MSAPLFLWVINQWNSSSQEDIDCPSINSFENRIEKNVLGRWTFSKTSSLQMLSGCKIWTTKCILDLDHHISLCQVQPHQVNKKVKVAHTRLPSIGFQSWSQFLAVSLQVTWAINPAVGCQYFLPGLQLPLQPLRGLLPVLLLGEQRHNGCEQFA